MTDINPLCCPKCGSERFAEFVYGNIFSKREDGRDLFDEIRKQRAINGGPIEYPESPHWLCYSCGKSWR